MPDTNEIGARGEFLFSSRITQGFIFRPCFLDAKWPIGDFYLEIVDEANPYPFLIQVKTTTQGYHANGKLKASVPIAKLKSLINRPLPTYIAGIDEIDEKVFICPAFDPNVGYSSIPTSSFVLDPGNKALSLTNLLRLRDEVIDFWNNSDVTQYKSQYNSQI